MAHHRRSIIVVVIVLVEQPPAGILPDPDRGGKGWRVGICRSRWSHYCPIGLFFSVQTSVYRLIEIAQDARSLQKNSLELFVGDSLSVVFPLERLCRNGIEIPAGWILPFLGQDRCVLHTVLGTDAGPIGLRFLVQRVDIGTPVDLDKGDPAAPKGQCVGIVLFVFFGSCDSHEGVAVGVRVEIEVAKQQQVVVGRTIVVIMIITGVVAVGASATPVLAALGVVRIIQQYMGRVFPVACIRIRILQESDVFRRTGHQYQACRFSRVVSQNEICVGVLDGASRIALPLLDDSQRRRRLRLRLRLRLRSSALASLWGGSF